MAPFKFVPETIVERDKRLAIEMANVGSLNDNLSVYKVKARRKAGQFDEGAYPELKGWTFYRIEEIATGEDFNIAARDDIILTDILIAEVRPLAV